MRRKSTTGARFTRAFTQSTSLPAGWNGFLILAGKTAEPVLVASLFSVSVTFLPLVHFSPQLNVVVFVARFIALDTGSLSLNKLADQAKKDGNDEGTKHTRRVRIALVLILLTGVILAGMDQVVKLDSQRGTVIDTMHLIVRAVMAVL